MERIEALPQPRPDATLEELQQYALDIANWAKRLEDRLLSYEVSGGGSLLSASLTPTSVGATSTDTQTFTLTGAENGVDIACVTHPIMPVDTQIDSCECTADDTVDITFSNNSGSPRTPTAGVYTFLSNIPVTTT